MMDVCRAIWRFLTTRTAAQTERVRQPPVRIHCSAEDEESDSRTIESERGEDDGRDDEVRRGCPVGGDE